MADMTDSSPASTPDERRHMLKTRMAAWPSLPDGERRVEIRRDDRGYRVGDLLVLREWDHASESYSGRECRAVVRHVLYHTDLACGSGLVEGFVALTVEPASPASTPPSDRQDRLGVGGTEAAERLDDEDLHRSVGLIADVLDELYEEDDDNRQRIPYADGERLRLLLAEVDRLTAERDEARDAVDVLTTTVRDQAGRLATAQAAIATAMAVQRVQTGQVEAVRGLMRAARQEADDAAPYARPGYRGVASVPVGDLDRALSGPTAGQPDRPEFTPDQLLGARHDQPDPTGPLVDFEEHSRDQR